MNNNAHNLTTSRMCKKTRMTFISFLLIGELFALFLLSIKMPVISFVLISLFYSAAALCIAADYFLYKDNLKNINKKLFEVDIEQQEHNELALSTMFKN